MQDLWPSIKRFFRSPRTITAELVGVAALGALSTIVPQASDRAALLRFTSDHPTWATLAEAFWLDRIIHGPWMVVLLGLSSASLAVVVVELWRRVRREWPVPPPETVERRAQYTRVVRLDRRVPVECSVRVEGRAGTLGSFAFHVGVLLVLAGGAVRAVAGVDAAAQVYEGEDLAPGAEAFPFQTGGILAPAFDLGRPARLESLKPELRPRGELGALSAVLTVGGDDSPHRLAINSPLDLGPRRLYLTSEIGPAVLVVVQPEAGPEQRTAVLLRAGGREARGSLVLDGETELWLRTEWDGAWLEPEPVEVRVLRRGVLAGGGTAGIGGSVEYPGGRVTVAAVRRWVELLGRRDPSGPIALFGLVVALAGAALMFLVVRVETAVRVEVDGGGSRVTIALRAERFAPLHAERFERLVDSWERRG